ncbi:MAG TPA: pyridoxal-phosphate dependent enzyme [Myxococcaceae bacterium]|jgi:cysteine synthase A
MDAARQGDCLLDLVGLTPTVRLQRVRPDGGAEIWLKLEHLNPSGSVEDRVGAALVDAGPIRARPERAIAVALAACVRGKPCQVTLTAPPTHEQREMLRLLGAEWVEQEPAIDVAQATHSAPPAPSPDMIASFRATLGAEVAAWVKALEPPTRLALIVAPPFLAPALDGAGVPVLAAPEVPAAEAASMAARLAREEGLLVGPATGANVVAALQAAAARPASQAVLAFALESGERYFSASMEPRA